MAMKTKTVVSQTTLRRRIRQFYSLLNRREFARCHQLIDPRVRFKPSSVTLFQYENALQEFLEEFGTVEVQEIRLDVHLNEPSRLYEGRDFAVGQTIWTDQAGEQHSFSERWVKEGRSWYTRSTGLVSPRTREQRL
jgi:hypothetical protein